MGLRIIRLRTPIVPSYIPNVFGAKRRGSAFLFCLIATESRPTFSHANDSPANLLLAFQCLVQVATLPAAGMI